MYNDYVKLSVSPETHKGLWVFLVSPNWLNWVRLAWRATYMHLAADHGMELLELQASAVTSETFLTFAGLLPLADEIENLQIVCCFRCFFSHMKWQQENSANIAVDSRFWLAASEDDCFILSFHWFISAGARQILHFSPQNAPQCPCWEDWESNCFVLKIKRFFLSLKLIWSDVL